MKETIELVKCDLCGATIDTKNAPEDEYHYRYHILRPNHDCIETLEKDICPTCASVINKIYNRKHSKVAGKYEYIDKYIEAVISDLSSDYCKNYFNKKDDEKEIIITPSQIRGIMRSIILFRDEFSNIFKS